MAANWPGSMASMVTGRAVVVVALDTSKFTRNSPVVASAKSFSSRSRIVRHGQQNVFHRSEFVLKPFGFLLGLGDQLCKSLRYIDLIGSSSGP